MSSNHHKSISSSITNKLTFEEVLKIFSEIDEKIISLHKCSSDDFLGLNNQFKQLHKESKTISDNAQKALDIITQDKSLEGLRNLLILKGQFKNQMQQVDLFLSNTGKILHGSISGFERHLYFLRNLRQNITTLKFLITNLKFKTSFNNCSDYNLESAISDLFTSMDKQIRKVHLLEKSFLDIKNILNENQNKLSILSENNNYALDNSTKSITKKINKLVDVRQSALLAIPRLKEVTKECRKSVSQIITNLQYHDIIKQKIDHIQLTHRNLVSELGILKESDTRLPIQHNMAKFFMQTRDIAGLQAAQLIHANKSYQNAIREITTSLKDIGERMSGISHLCNQFVSQPELFEVLDEKDLQLQLEKFSEQVNNDRDQIEELSVSTTDALRMLKEIKKNYPSFHQGCITLLNGIIKIINQFQKAENDSVNQGVNQAGILISEYEEIINRITEEIDKGSENMFSLHKTQSSFVAGRTDYLNRLCSITDNLLCARGKNITDKLGTLQANIREGSIITQSIRTSIDQVKYYDFFEKVIEEIIAELNNINYKLKFIDPHHTGISMDNNLQHLKDLYTMESEHRIHERFSKGFNSIEFTDPVSQKATKQENEDNLELF